MSGVDIDILDAIHNAENHIAALASNSAYCVKVRGTDLWPRLRAGDYLQISPVADCHPGDMVAIKTKKSSLLIRDYVAHHETETLLSPISGKGPRVDISDDEILFMHKIQAIIPSTMDETSKG